MGYTFEPLPGEPIVHVTLANPFDFERDVTEILNRIAELIADSDDIFYIIYDVRDFRFNFAEIVAGMAAAFRPRSFDLSSIADRSRMIAVGSSDLLKLAVSGAKQLQYGGRNVELFETLDEALAYARQQIAADRASR